MLLGMQGARLMTDSDAAEGEKTRVRTYAAICIPRRGSLAFFSLLLFFPAAAASLRLTNVDGYRRPSFPAAPIAPDC